MATKLHEILAVEGDLDSAQQKLVEEATATFSKKADHFIETHKKLVMFNDDRQGENMDETKALVTSVADKLAYVQKSIVSYLNTFATKERTNQVASADLIVDGVVIASSLPATALLGLETKLKALRPMYEAIPTLAPGFEWEKDLS